MVHLLKRHAAVLLALVASAGCTVHNTETPAISGPSTLALSLNLNAVPDSISQDGGSQSSIKITAIGPNGKGVASLPLRIDTRVAGVPQDYGTLSARTVVTNADGIATLVYTAPPSPAGGAYGLCGSLVGTCVEVIATPTGSNFDTATSQSVSIRLVPPGVILAPASTPTAAFIVTPSTVSANLPINFDASSSQAGTGASQIVTYSWTFGDGTTGTGKTVTHTYASGNNFTVTLTVTNDRGLSASSSQQLGVGAAALPTPLFTVSPSQPAVNEPVFFNGSTSTPGAGHSTITSYRWSFGDGQTGSGQTVSHSYSAAGSYSVQLTVTDEAGQSNTSAATAVAVGGAPTPTAKFTYSPSAPVIGETVIFDWRTTTSPQGQRIVGLDWNFGDDTPVVHCPGHAACTSEGITTHVFSKGGTFAVNLVVTDSAGRTNATSVPVSVGSGNPAAVLLVTKTGVGTVQADGSASFATGNATIANYTFFWGDGSTPTSSSAPSASHTYTLIGGAGTFTITMRVTDSLGRITTSTAQAVTFP
jgi:PKD repeat protein